MADVDGVDAGGPTLEQAIGEATGRRPRIEGTAAADKHGEAGQRRIELQSASAHEGRGRAEDDHRLVGRNEARRLVRGCTRDEDAAGGDRRLGLVPAGEEAPSHELGVEPAAGAGAQLAAFLTDLAVEAGFLAGAFLVGALCAAEFLAGAFLAAVLRL